jgi:serine/threonine protein phosphatase 1
MSTLVIGDIHGCFVELEELLEKAGLSPEDTVIALGDIVDRGPETPQVLDFFRHQPDTFSLMGNHERKHIRSYRGEIKPALSQVITREQLEEAYPEAVAYMAALASYVELPEAILVHGYLKPGIPLAEQRVTVLCGTMGGERHLRLTYDRPWYELYEGEKPVIVGHYDYLRNGQPFVYQNRVFGLDTGCVHGGALTGLLLPAFRFGSVPCRGDLWSLTRRQYRQQHALIRAAKPATRPKEAETWDADTERAFQAVLAYVVRENERVLSELGAQPGFADQTPRQQAKAYAEAIGETPLAALMHLARRGELAVERSRRVFGDSRLVRGVAAHLGFR